MYQRRCAITHVVHTCMCVMHRSAYSDVLGESGTSAVLWSDAQMLTVRNASRCVVEGEERRL